MSLVSAPVQLANLSERRDASCQDVGCEILPALDEDGPIGTLHETLTRTPSRNAARLGDVEELLDNRRSSNPQTVDRVCILTSEIALKSERVDRTPHLLSSIITD